MSPKQQTCTISHICITVLWDNYCFHLKKKKNLYSENQEVFPKKKKKKKPKRETEKRQNRKQLQRAKLGLYCCSDIHSTYTSYQSI